MLRRRKLVAELDVLRATTPRRDWGKALVALLKGHLEMARETIRTRFERDRLSGLTAAQTLSSVVDQILRVLYDFTVTDLYPSPNPTEGERLCLIATGGYGRGELAPFSDIDIMFLIPYKLNPWLETVIESMLYSLWDMGFKLGYSVRSFDEVERLASQDLTILTSLLEARYVWGDQKIFRQLEVQFRSQILPQNADSFVEDKLAERDARHARLGDSRYVVEPNIKDGKGGLRDLQTMWWIAHFIKGGADRRELVDAGLFTDTEYTQFCHAENFLWSVRFALHYKAGRAQERLTFDMQRDLSEAFRYKSRPGASAVERFLKHYFYIAKQVGDLTRIFCAVLEERQQKRSLRERFLPRGRLKGFSLERERITLRRAGDFESDPARMVEMFKVAHEHSLDIHPNALRAMKHSLRRIDDSVRQDPRAVAAFMDVLTADTDTLHILRRMNESGVFGRFIPDFGRVVGQMQYDMYHHFTVDEHTIQATALLSKLASGALVSEHPLASELIHKLVSRRVLSVAVLLHDIAKGRDGDHSILGAEVAREMGPKLGLSRSETETVAWLVRWHLLMSNTAFKRDLADPKTIEDFAGHVKSPERLKLLLILTVVDIRAVGPGVWNGWKGQLLRELYHAAEEVLIAGHASAKRLERVAHKKETVRRALSDAGLQANDYLERWRDAYWIAEDIDTLVAGALLVDEVRSSKRPLVINMRHDQFQSITRVSLYTKDRVGLFARIVAGLTSAGVSIIGARIHTALDGMALDHFSVQTPTGQAVTDPRMLERLEERVRTSVLKAVPPRERLLSGSGFDQRSDNFEVEPSVIIDNKASSQATVIEVGAKDRPGLLYDLTQALFQLKLNIVSAHIATFGERAVDVFYVTDKSGKKAEHTLRLKNITARLMAAVEGNISPAIQFDDTQSDDTPLDASTLDASTLDGTNPAAPPSKRRNVALSNNPKAQAREKDTPRDQS